MTNAHCKIRNPKPKLQIVPKSTNEKEYREFMHKYADIICDDVRDMDSSCKDFAAVVMVAIRMDGSFSVTKRINNDAMFGSSLLPALVSECMRVFTMEKTAIDVFNGKLR